MSLSLTKTAFLSAHTVSFFRFFYFCGRRNTTTQPPSFIASCVAQPILLFFFRFCLSLEYYCSLNFLLVLLMTQRFFPQMQRKARQKLVIKLARPVAATPTHQTSITSAAPPMLLLSKFTRAASRLQSNCRHERGQDRPAVWFFIAFAALVPGSARLFFLVNR